MTAHLAVGVVSHLIACFPGFSSVCHFFDSIVSLIKQITELITNPIGWFYDNFIKPFFDIFTLSQSMIDQLAGKIYKALTYAALVLTGIGAVIRIVKSLYDERATPANVLVDNLFRFGAVYLILNGGTSGGAVLYQGLTLVMTQAATLGGSAFVSVLGANFTIANLGKALAHIAFSSILTPGPSILFAAVCVVVIALCAIYFEILLLARSVMALMSIATAPIFVATAAYDSRNRFLTFWIDLTVGAIVMPFVIALFSGVTLALAFGALAQGPTISIGTQATADVIQATIIMIAGTWLTGKAISQITWKHFSHNGVTGALTAGAGAIMALPNAAADAKAIGGAVGDVAKGKYSGHGGAASALASIPSRRLYGSSWGKEGGEGGGAGGGGGGGGPTEESRASDAAGAASASAAAGGAGFNSYAALAPGLKAAVGNPAAMVAGGDAAIASQWSNPAHRQMVGAMMASRPDVASRASAAMLPFLLDNNYSGAGEALKGIVLEEQKRAPLTPEEVA